MIRHSIAFFAFFDPCHGRRWQALVDTGRHEMNLVKFRLDLQEFSVYLISFAFRLQSKYLNYACEKMKHLL